MQRQSKECLARTICVLIFGLMFVSLDGSKPIKRAPPKPRSCADRQEEVLEQMYGHLAAGMLNAYHHTLQLLDRENLTCPARAQLDSRQQLPVNINSISPWAYRITFNPTRYPKYMPEAYCLCKGCLIGPLGEENTNYRSVPVYMPTVILRRTSSCAGGRYIYIEEYTTIPVGCTCVTEQEKEAEPDSNSSLDKDKFKVSLNRSDKPPTS